jgi:hypothetical protein
MMRLVCQKVAKRLLAQLVNGCTLPSTLRLLLSSLKAVASWYSCCVTWWIGLLAHISLFTTFTIANLKQCLVGSWNTMKEVGLLLGRMTQLLCLAPPAPLPPLLSYTDLNTIGTFFTHALSNIKHNGATEKLHLGFGSLCRVLLMQQHVDLNGLPAVWLKNLLEVLTRRDQTRTNIVRRSAGLPLAFLAAFVAEPTGSSKRLLPWAAKQLLGIAAGSSPQQPIPMAVSGQRTADDMVVAHELDPLSKGLGFMAVGKQRNPGAAFVSHNGVPQSMQRLATPSKTTLFNRPSETASTLSGCQKASQESASTSNSAFGMNFQKADAVPVEDYNEDALDDGVWMRVHAFNCLRVMFDSSALAADISAFLAEGLKLCVLAMLDAHWEVCPSVWFQT